MRSFLFFIVIFFTFCFDSAKADFTVDQSALAEIVAKAKAEKVAALELAQKEREAAEYAEKLKVNPYLEDVVLYDSAYKTVSQNGAGRFVLSGSADGLSLLSVIDRILPPGFKLVASGEHILVEPTITWLDGEDLSVVLERTGIEHLLEFVIDWDKKVLAIREADGANHTVLFDGRYSPVYQTGIGAHFVDGSSDAVNLTAALDAIMPEDFKVVSVNPDVLANASVSWNHDESLVAILERAGLDNILSFDLNWDQRLVIVRGGKAFSPHQVAASQFISRSFFIPFLSGEVNEPKDMEPLLSAAKVILENASKLGSIKVTGVSKSKSDNADAKLLEKYASHRANSVHKKLAQLGSPEEIMILDSDFVRGFVKDVSGALVQVFGKSPKTKTYSATTSNKPLPNCGNLNFSRTSLRFNIDRAIRDCGFSIGSWQFGDKDTVADWLVENPYSVIAGRTIDDVLAHIGATYGINSTRVGSLVDFFEAGEVR
ncbi:hypothetical protein N9L66_00380 [Porticoccaceae bacterium]|nr:hypothetical protein [Porticoccaceae bacterium]MDA8682041.1 hypothetical protein [Porticoccaceae bacterium]MDA8788776.1 hypothetical protein [Porticoccaceae bacterium]MDB2343057.1 hypothetical protein [Porticoccaceae bacterium]